MNPRLLIVWRGLPTSLAQIVQRAARGDERAVCLCILEPGESSEPLKRLWFSLIQPLHESLTLFVFHESADRAFERIREFACELGQEVNLAYISDESSWQGARHLASSLRKLTEAEPQIVVRRL